MQNTIHEHHSFLLCYIIYSLVCIWFYIEWLQDALLFSKNNERKPRESAPCTLIRVRTLNRLTVFHALINSVLAQNCIATTTSQVTPALTHFRRHPKLL